MIFPDVLAELSGLTHYYPLNTDAKDAIGGVSGGNHGATFSAAGATFDGKSYIELPDSDDMSVATRGALSIVVFLTIADWHGAGASEYVHWMGKGVDNAHEWTFRHYVQGGTGEAPVRQGRTSFYHFNPAGGLGAGSYFQDGTLPTRERVIVATCDMKTMQLYVDGLLKDADALSGYSIVPKNTGTPTRLGTRDMTTGFLVGKIRRVAFFNRVLSAAEVTTIYNARTLDETSVTPPPPPPPTPDYTQYLTTGTNDVSKKHNALVNVLHGKGII